MTSATRSLSPAYLPHLPLSVRKLLDEAERLSAAGLPVRFDQLPSVQDLESAVRACSAKLGDMDENHAKRCYAKLLTTFESGTKQGEKEMRLRFGGFFDACKDLPPDLWESATTSCTQELKWMPKPAEFREQVKVELDARRLRLKRAKDMLEAAKSSSAKTGFVPEHPDVRDAALIASWTKVGRYDKANAVEERMARRQGRPPILVPAPDVAHLTGSASHAPAVPEKSPADREADRRRAFEAKNRANATDVPDWTTEAVPESAYGED